MYRYRGWVFGLGFGVQLGAGVVTIVTVSAVYATILAEFLSRSVATGAGIGLTFGVARAVTLLPAAGVRSPGALARVGRWLWDHEARSRRLAHAAEAVVGGLAVAMAALAAWPRGGLP